MTFRHLARVAGSSSPSSMAVSTYRRMLVSGVRSSCVAWATKACRASSATFCWVMSSMTTMADGRVLAPDRADAEPQHARAGGRGRRRTRRGWRIARGRRRRPCARRRSPPAAASPRWPRRGSPPAPSPPGGIARRRAALSFSRSASRKAAAAPLAYFTRFRSSTTSSPWLMASQAASRSPFACRRRPSTSRTLSAADLLAGPLGLSDELVPRPCLGAQVRADQQRRGRDLCPGPSREASRASRMAPIARSRDRILR